MFPVHERRRTKYVGRKEEFSTMESILSEVKAGKGKLVMIEGEAGIGKTRFTEELRKLDAFRGYIYLKGRCLYFKDTDVYLPFKEMFNQYWEMRSKAKGEELRSPFIDENGDGPDGIEGYLKEEEFLPMSLIPADADIEGFKEEMPLEGLMRYDKLSQFIFNLASEGSVCLLIDDLHWADPPSLQLLYYLSQKIIDQRILIICTYRPEDLFWGGDNSHPLSESIKRFNRDHLYVPLKLNRLGKVETDEIIRSVMGVNDVPSSFSELMYARTLGNPFFVEEVLYSLIERGVIATGSVESIKNIDVNSISLPSNLKDVIQRRVHWLKPISIKVIRFASVSGESFNFDIIREALELKDEDIIEALEELIQAKFIIEAKEEERYEFENPVILEVIYSELNQSRRRFLHTKMAKVLEDRSASDPDQWATIAMHFYKGKDFEKALNYLTKAASYYQNIAPQRALEYLHLVLDCTERLPQSDAIKSHNMAVLMEISNLCLQVGDIRRSMEFAERALNLASVLKESRTLTRAKLNIADIFRLRGDFDTSMRYYEDSIKTSQADDFYEGMAIAYMGVGYIHWIRGGYSRSLEMYSKSLQYAKIENNLKTIGRLYIHIGDLFHHRGDLDKSIDYYTRGIRHLETISDSLSVSLGYSRIAEVKLELGSLDEAEDNVKMAVEKAKEQGRPDFKPPYIQLIRLRCRQGKRKEAKIAFEVMMDSPNSSEERIDTNLAQLHMAECLSYDDDRVGAETYFRQANDSFKAMNVPYELGRTRLLWAEHLMRKDDSSGAREMLEDAISTFRSIGAKCLKERAQELLSEIGQ